MIEAKEIEGELWIKATDHHKEVKNAHERGVQDGMKREHALWELAKIGQEIELGITYEEANPPKPYCKRCGKKLGTEVTDIHTCTPMKKEWVGLTKEEITHIGLNCYSLQQTADAIEAKLKEKND